MTEIKMGPYNRIFTDDSFLIAIGHYLSEKKKTDSSVNFLTEKKFTVKDTDTTYRVMNHWSKLGLFEDDRTDINKGWRKFSLADMAWLRVLMQLREFGLSLEKIKIGYQEIKKKLAIFECGIALCMMRKSIKLVVFSDGHMEVVPHSALIRNESMGYLKEEAYLVVCLNGCLGRILPHKNYSPKYDAFELSDKEITILSEIRSGACDEISIHMKNGDIDRIDTKVKHIGEVGKLADIFNMVTHGDFIIKKVDGKICFVESINKKKV